VNDEDADALREHIKELQVQMATIQSNAKSTQTIANDGARQTRKTAEQLQNLRLESESIKLLSHSTERAVQRHNQTLYDDRTGHVTRLNALEKTAADTASMKRYLFATLAALVIKTLIEVITRHPL